MLAIKIERRELVKTGPLNTYIALLLPWHNMEIQYRQGQLWEGMLNETTTTTTTDICVFQNCLLARKMPKYLLNFVFTVYIFAYLTQSFIFYASVSTQKLTLQGFSLKTNELYANQEFVSMEIPWDVIHICQGK